MVLHQPRTPAVLLASDVDGTFWPEGVSLATLRDTFARRPARLDVVFVSSRSVPELAALARDVGADEEFIAENGAVVVTQDPDTARHLGAERAGGAARGFVRVAAGAPSAAAIAVAARDAACDASAPVTLLLDLPPAARAGALRDPVAWRDAMDRRASVLAEADWAHPATTRWADALRQQGLEVASGGRLTTIWHGWDKGTALRAYVAARRAAGRGPSRVVAVGDAANDASLLAAAERRFAMPDPTGAVDAALQAIPGLEVAPCHGVAGWHAVTLLAVEAP